MYGVMAEPDRSHKETPITSITGATRSSRSSTLPSQQAPPSKHRYRHRHHNSTSYRSGNSHRFPADATAQTTPSTHTSPLSPLGEILSSGKWNVGEGLSGVTGRRDRERDKDKWRGLSPDRVIEQKENVPDEIVLTPLKLERVKQQRRAAERSLEQQYNKLASRAFEQHNVLADSRSSMLRIIGRLDSTLSSLSKLNVDTNSLLEALTRESIPELTEESKMQLETFRKTISKIETDRITKMQARVEIARDNTTRLGDRMAEVRSRIKAWEEKEADEDRRRRRRVGFVWGTIATMILLVILLLIWGRMNERLDAQKESEQDWREILIEKQLNKSTTNSSEVPIEELLKSLQEEDFSSGRIFEEVLPGEEGSSEAEDGRLSSIFDEL